jgi:hypothetical protein
MAKAYEAPQVFLESVRRAQRNQMPVGWLGWLVGAVFTALGAYDPSDAPLLLAVGIVLLVGMTVFTVRRSVLNSRLGRLGREKDDERVDAVIDRDFSVPSGEPGGTAGGD